MYATCVAYILCLVIIRDCNSSNTGIGDEAFFAFVRSFDYMLSEMLVGDFCGGCLYNKVYKMAVDHRPLCLSIKRQRL